MDALSLAVEYWSGSPRAEFTQVPSDITVGELLREVTEAMRLPRRTPFKLVRSKRELPRAHTLKELGIENGTTLEVAPEVSAG